MSNHPSSSMALSHLNSTFDTELDNLFDLENNLSTAASPAVPSLLHRPTLSSSGGSFTSSQSSQAFSGPSFQYDAYKQQTGLPVGGLANTFAVNRSSGLQYNSNTGFVMPADTLNVPLTNMDDYDFGRTPTLDFNDMDFDGEESSDLPAMFFPSSNGQDDSPTFTAPFQRMYPGMHTQQAAQAKAQAAEKQQEMVRLQQEQQQRAMAAAGQRPLPSSNGKGKDPVVEESISRLLNQMRQNSVVSAEDDDADTPTNQNFSSGRRHKNEEDMDEDEMLLASEEGKKLSSKERRQLRNKVSARAFRSRRKEYIGQLEGELAGRSQEVSDLKAQNKQLLEENTRLTDLTRMLLSSPSFSGFVNELSANGMAVPPQIKQEPSVPAPQPMPKDLNPSRASRQMHSQQPQIGMALLPESATDFSALAFDGWNSGISNDFRIYSVTDLPQGPVLDLEKLSGKDNKTLSTSYTSTEPKDMPKKLELPCLPQQSSEAKPLEPAEVDPTIHLDQDAFSLYFDTTPAAPETALTVNAKATEDLTTQLEQAIAALEMTSARLALMSPHM